MRTLLALLGGMIAIIGLSSGCSQSGGQSISLSDALDEMESLDALGRAVPWKTYLA